MKTWLQHISDWEEGYILFEKINNAGTCL
uniref:Protein disulfide-isomerase a4 n=1 Tax=Triatoma infestans TaxID=30076 RepID=A0A161MHS5_TRIIF